MFLFVALFFAADSAAYNQAELDSLCDIYYSKCERTTNCDYPSIGTNVCNNNIDSATAACNSEVSNHDFAKCFMNYDTDYFTNCTEYRYLALCLFEETKDVHEFSCYNGGTKAVECPSSLSDGIEFNLQSVNYSADSVPTGSQYWTVLSIDFGTFSVTTKPYNCGFGGKKKRCSIDPYLIPHINLHSCLMTEKQKTCSCLMLETEESNATVSFTYSNAAMPSDSPFPLHAVFKYPGTYRLIAHIQFYENIGNSETVFWDLANGIDLTVIDPQPTNAPTVEAIRRSTDVGNVTAIVVCVAVLACYMLLYLYYKCIYEPRTYTIDDVEYDVNEESSEESVLKDEDFTRDDIVFTNIEETKVVE